jgi:hypothetical protein
MIQEYERFMNWLEGYLVACKFQTGKDAIGGPLEKRIAQLKKDLEGKSAFILMMKD